MLERGVDRTRTSFTQHYDTTEVDASLLVLPMLGFIDGDDPLMKGTIRAVEEDLMRDGLLLRYRTESGVDGLPGDEHPFLACSFWLVSAYAAAGRVDEAEELLERLLAHAQRRGAARRGGGPGDRTARRQLPAGVLPPDAGRRRARPARSPGPASGP